MADAAGLQYQGNLNFNTGFGAENLHIVTSDLNHTGVGRAAERHRRSSVTVAAVNDNPNLQPDTTTAVSYTENAGPTTLFSAETINSPLADPDQSANFLGGSLTVGVTSGFVAGDEIVADRAVRLASTSSGRTLRISGNNIIGTISGNASQTVTVSSLTALATPAWSMNWSPRSGI